MAELVAGSSRLAVRRLWRAVRLGGLSCGSAGLGPTLFERRCCSGQCARSSDVSSSPHVSTPLDQQHV